METYKTERYILPRGRTGSGSGWVKKMNEGRGGIGIDGSLASVFDRSHSGNQDEDRPPTEERGGRGARAHAAREPNPPRTTSLLPDSPWWS